MRKLICAFILFAFSWLLALTGFVCKIKADTSYEITFIEWLPDLRIKYTAEAFHTYSTIFYILAAVFLLAAVVVAILGLIKHKPSKA
jgi:Na+/melibiose symporter-like transporter